MERRHFLSVLGGAAMWPGVAGAQQQAGRVARIGFIEAGTKQANLIFLTSFKEGLLAFGWIEGRNISIEDRWAEARNDLLPEIVAGLITSGVDILVTAATPASLAAKHATATIPVVMVGVSDPIGLGLIESLARPGGNVTGLSSLSEALSAKRMQLLHEVLPTAVRVAVIWNPKGYGSHLAVRDAKAAAEALGLDYLSIEVVTPDEIERVFSGLRDQRPDALFVIDDPLTLANRDSIVARANELSLPIFAGFRPFAVSGALVSLGTSLPNDFKKAATFVDKILKGAKPADLPVEQPTQFVQVINLKSAKALGLTIAPLILARADEVIE